jgi:putative ABC transport system permease protein
MLLQEIRHAVRLLARTPGFTAIAVLSLTIGIGTNAALFSFQDAIFWRPLPVRDPAAVVTVTTEDRDGRWPNADVSYPNYRDLRSASTSFEGLVAFQFATVSFARSRQAVRESRLGMLVSENFFDVLGVTPLLGRTFTADEGRVPGRDAVVVLGYDFWRNTLGEDRSIVGRTVVMNGFDFTVIGVLPEQFTGMDQFIRPPFYAPITMTGQLNGGPEEARRAAAGELLEQRQMRAVRVKGRLASNVSLEAARAELTTLWNTLVQQYPDANRNRSIGVRTEMQERRRTDPINAMLGTLMTTLVGLVLVIACANVANLMLGRSRARSREIAIRLALGISRVRLLRQLLTESVLLALAGGVLGLAFAYGGIRFIMSLARMQLVSDLPIVVEPRINGRVLIVGLLATTAATLFFGVAPAWQSLKTQLVTALKGSEPGGMARHRTIGRNVLVSAQVALSMVLLVAAGMLVEGFRTTLNMNPGFRTDHLMMMSVDTSVMAYPEARTRDFHRALMDRVRSLPGVAAAALTSAIPLGPTGQDVIVPEGYQFPRGQTSVPVPSAVVDDQYFATLNIGIVRGRAFTPEDDDRSRRVAIVNEAFVDRFWPDRDPVGKRIQLTDAVSGGVGRAATLEVVGVARTTKYLNVGEGPTPFLYQPAAQNPRAAMSVFVQTTSADAASLSGSLRDVVRGLDANLPVFDLRPFESFYQGRAIAPRLMLMRVVSLLGVMGLTMALIGLYGLVTYSVARRTKEIGLRMAVGAGKADVLRMVLGQGLMLSAAGILVGAIASIAVARVLTTGMAGLGATNLATYFVVPLALVALTLAASYLPARRAAAVDPLRALKYE